MSAEAVPDLQTARAGKIDDTCSKRGGVEGDSQTIAPNGVLILLCSDFSDI